MFWDWLLLVIYCLGTVCSIANMTKAQNLSGKIVRMLLATGMFMLTILYGNTMLVMMLEGIA